MRLNPSTIPVKFLSINTGTDVCMKITLMQIYQCNIFTLR